MEGLNDIDGVTCLPSDGAMYAFPRVELPPKALDEAALHEQTPDSLYALSLLEETGEYHTQLWFASTSTVYLSCTLSF